MKTPKSPAKSEPPTPSKKVKEIPPIPTFDLYMVLAAGNHLRFDSSSERVCNINFIGLVVEQLLVRKPPNTDKSLSESA